MSKLSEFVGDRIQVNSVLIVLCFVSVLLLDSQSAASYPTYLLALAMLFTVRQWNDVFRVKLAWLVVGLLAYLSASAFWSEPFVWRDAASVISRALLVFFFVVAFSECQLRGQMRRWLRRALAIVGILATGAAIANFLITQPEDGRLNGLGQLDTHVIAALVYGVVLIFVAEILLTESSVVWRSVAAVSAVAIAAAVFLSDSRNAWVSVIIGLSVFVLAHSVKDRQRFVASVAAVGVTLAMGLVALASDESVQEILLPRGDSFRPGIWAYTVDRVLSDGRWVGLGINTSNDLELGGIVFLHTHNMYLSVLFQGGMVGLGGFVALIAWVLGVLLRWYDQQDAKLALGILAVALPAYLLDGHELVDKVGSTWFLFWLPVAIGMGFAWRILTQRS